jgi:salicylate hydroxylase
MCLEDGSSLAECLDRAVTKSDIPKCLRAFETIRKPRTTLFSKTADEQSKLMVSKDPREIKSRDRLRKERSDMMPEIWDGKHIDKVPESWRDPMYGHWSYAYNVLDFVSFRSASS